MKNITLLFLSIFVLNSVCALADNVSVNEKFKGYLFAYFEGSGDKNKQEQLRFAVSADAVNWSALNRNNPIIASDTISVTGGIRDPHILRGVDNKSFYMVATDMFTVKNGWDYNPGIILMKSADLINWSHKAIDIEKTYPGKFKNIKWVWAPQTIYDPTVKKYLVYFTVRFRHNEYLDFYCAYANKDFTAFEAVPKLMFRAKYGAIDGDIIFKDGLYHFFYKGNTKNSSGKEIENGIQQATSKSLKGPWKEEFKYLDAYSSKRVSVEGSSIFKLNDKDEYILMYDLYRDHRFEFQRSKDLFEFSATPESFNKNFNPRHGSVISITASEAKRLEKKWGGVPQDILNQMDLPYCFKTSGNPIFTHKYTADPATLVKGDTLWLFTGHDAEGGLKGYKMKDWCVFSTTDMVNWTEYPTPLKVTDFKWDRTGAAYAGHVEYKNGKYYWYISTNGSGIGVAVSDKPEGPYKDVLGKPLLTNKDCFGATHSWVCIDPAIFTDDNGQSWIFWGNRICYYAKLKDNMIEIDGEIKTVNFPGFSFTEAPWVHKYNKKYYLTYATEFPEKIAYAMADNIEGPYEYKGLLTEIAGNSNTIHPAICQFKGQWYFFYHNGGLNTQGGSYSRSVCAEYLEHQKNGAIKKIEMSTAGADRYYMPFDNKNNPVIEGYYADPEVLYSNKTGKYYMYPTSDGIQNWDGYNFKAFSSADLKNWKDEGVILDLKKDTKWAEKNAWAPTIIEKKVNNNYKYYYYFSAAKKIGVAVSDNPEGPFRDPIGKPIIDFKPDGRKNGQEIDPDVFHDPVSGKDYLYWGSGYLAVAELNNDMVSVKKETIKVLTPNRTYREAPEIFYRNGLYYFLWSENDTRSEDYRVRYATSKSPIGPLDIPQNNLVISKNPDKGIYGTGHNSVLKVNGKDEWYIVYHRFRRPNAIKMGWSAGYHREVCIDKLEFGEDGSIKESLPSL